MQLHDPLVGIRIDLRDLGPSHTVDIVRPDERPVSSRQQRDRVLDLRAPGGENRGVCLVPELEIFELFTEPIRGAFLRRAGVTRIHP